MNSIATVKYIYNPLNNKAFLYLKSPALESLYRAFGYPIRNYTRNEYELFADFSAYLVRGLAIDSFHEFKRNDITYKIYTQKCGSNHILHMDGNSSIVNISHIRGVGLTNGFKYQIRPISNPLKVKQTMLAYCEGVIEYYNCLKKEIKLKDKYAKMLDTK